MPPRDDPRRGMRDAPRTPAPHGRQRAVLGLAHVHVHVHVPPGAQPQLAAPQKAGEPIRPRTSRRHGLRPLGHRARRTCLRGGFGEQRLAPQQPRKNLP